MDTLSTFLTDLSKEEQKETMVSSMDLSVIRLPRKGQWSSSISRTIVSVACSAYYAVDVKCVYVTSRAFNLRKDVLLSQQKSNLVYESECQDCNSRYVGRTTQRLSVCICQHAPLLKLKFYQDVRAFHPTAKL